LILCFCLLHSPRLVGVWEAETGQRLTLVLLHRFGLARVVVVAAEQMQYAVNGEMGVMGGIGNSNALFWQSVG